MHGIGVARGGPAGRPPTSKQPVTATPEANIASQGEQAEFKRADTLIHAAVAIAFLR